MKVIWAIGLAGAFNVLLRYGCVRATCAVHPPFEVFKRKKAMIQFQY